jgi:hypothetical protein
MDKNNVFSLAHSNLSLLIFYIISFISFIWWILFFLIWHLANFKAISKKSIVQNEGRTALMSAPVGNKIEIVEWLFKNGADLNSLQRTLQDDSLILYGNNRSEEQMSIDFYIKRDSLIHILLKESKDK